MKPSWWLAVYPYESYLFLKLQAAAPQHSFKTAFILALPTGASFGGQGSMENLQGGPTGAGAALLYGVRHAWRGPLPGGLCGMNLHGARGR